MRRLIVLALVLAVGGCGTDDDAPDGSTVSGAGTIEPTSSDDPATTGQAPSPELQLPSDAPTSVDDAGTAEAIEAGDVAALIPPGAEETARVAQSTPSDPIDQVVVGWRRGSDPFAPEVGVVIWQRFEHSPVWRAVYAFTDRPRSEVLGVRISSTDLTGDGVDDILTEETRAGSGACATWRVIESLPGSASETFRHEGCDTEIRVADGALEIREALYRPDDPHCCPTAFRTSVVRWDGRAWQELSSELERSS